MTWQILAKWQMENPGDPEYWYQEIAITHRGLVLYSVGGYDSGWAGCHEKTLTLDSAYIRLESMLHLGMISYEQYGDAYAKLERLS